MCQCDGKTRFGLHFPQSCVIIQTESYNQEGGKTVWKVAAEVEQAMKLQEELASDARKKLREAKKAEIREKIVKTGEAIREAFNKIYSK